MAVAEDDGAEPHLAGEQVPGALLGGAAGAEVAVGDADPHAVQLQQPPRAEALVQLGAVVVAGDAVERGNGREEVDGELGRPVAGVQDAVDALAPEPVEEPLWELSPEAR